MPLDFASVREAGPWVVLAVVLISIGIAGWRAFTSGRIVPGYIHESDVKRALASDDALDASTQALRDATAANRESTVAARAAAEASFALGSRLGRIEGQLERLLARGERELD